jgi:hypothetical protein
MRFAQKEEGLVGDAQFWRERKTAFRTSDKEEYRSLRAHWNSITDTHVLLGSEQAQRRFELLAEAAARGLANPQGVELWKLWLAELIRRKINYSESPYTFEYPEAYLENPGHPLRRLGEPLPVVEGRRTTTGATTMVFEGTVVSIDRLFEASAVLCEVFESLAEHRSEGDRKAKKPTKQSEKYKQIDKALREIAAARPRNHEEVFRQLDARKVPIPNSKPFKAARSWLKGFHQDRHAATAWLSQSWARLGLPTFARGPKK